MPSSILVVDDEADLELLVRHNFRQRITSGELAFLFAANGKEALGLLQAHPEIELVVTDINMPVMDGLTLLAHISELDRLLKVVIVSAYDDLDNIRTAMNRGAYDFLTKPIDFADVEKTIDKTLRDLVNLREGIAARARLAELDYELSVATRIQRSILPEMIRGDGTFEIAATMLPAREVSGDFYDFFLIDAHHMGLAIGDVSGKGIPAALFMAVSRTLLRATALHGGKPHECLEHVNRVLLRQRESEVFLTLLYGILNLGTGDFEFSAGAQPPPYLCSRQGSSRFLHEPRGMMLGVMDEATYESRTVRLEPGDGLLLYTDGVTEAESSSDEFFTGSRLSGLVEANKLQTLDSMVSNIVEGLKGFTLGREQSDDITMLAVRFRP
jgi:sigma-B regulation protein RsbU (phosphoserine phosphatase)